MSIKLRGYQIKLIDDARNKLRNNASVVIQLMVGGGKTALAAFMLGEAAKKGKRSFFNVHRKELIDQTAETFDKVGIRYGIIASGYPANPYPFVQICSVDTLKNRLEKVTRPDLIIEDECHHSVSVGRKKILDFYKGVKVVGLTATPERLDGRGLDETFDSMVFGPEPEWLIDKGFLSKYKVFAPSSVDMTGVKTVLGDFDKTESMHLVATKKIMGDVIREYLKIGKDKKAIVFCISVQHSMNVCATFIENGIAASHLDGSSDKRQRAQSIHDFKSGKIKVLCNVELFGEGFNLPDIDAVILLRPTQSLGLFIQQCGRALRASPNKEYAYIIDHVDNVRRHGFPCEVREWSLNAKKRSKRSKSDSVTVKQCPKCYYCHKPAQQCPECGHIYEVKKVKIEEIDTELKELDKKEVYRKNLQEQGMAKTYSELVELGKKRGYSNPVGWAYNIIRTRKKS